MATIADLGARALRRLGVVAVADAEQPTLSATTTAADIATRALQSLGIIVPASDRPAIGTVSAASIAARAMQNLGVVVPEGDRPVVTTATVTVTELAARALQAMGVPVPASAWPAAGGTVTYNVVALEALIRLGVIAAEETPQAADTALAEAAAQAVHESLVRKGLVTWGPTAIPLGVRQDYGMLVALQLATSYGKQGDLAQRQVLEDRIGWSSLVQRAQALAEARIAAIYAGLAGAGMAAYGPNAIPASVSEPYVALLMIDLAPLFNKQADPGRIPQFEAQIRRDALTRRAQGDAVGLVASVHARLAALGIVDWDLASIPASVAEDYAELIANDYRPLFGAPQDRTGEPVIEARIRRMAMVERAQALALARVAVVHDALVSQGNASWPLSAIPQAVADEYAGLVAQSVAPSLGQAADPKMIAALEERVRRAALVARGQALAEQAVQAVHDDLAARGKARWTIRDIPRAAERPYVMLAAYHLAPEFGVTPSEPDRGMATIDLIRLAALPSSGERTRAEYF
jgi:hypothetical protein